MTGHVVENWRLIAQSMGGLADHLRGMVGVQTKPLAFADLPPNPKSGMIACIRDSTAGPAWGSVAAGGGSTTVLVWYNGTNWMVIGT